MTRDSYIYVAVCGLFGDVKQDGVDATLLYLYCSYCARIQKPREDGVARDVTPLRWGLCQSELDTSYSVKLWYNGPFGQ